MASGNTFASGAAGAASLGSAAGGVPVTIGVLDNDVMAADAVCRCLAGLSPLFRVVWRDDLAASAIHRCLMEEDRPQVLVTDMALSDMTGVEVCETIRRETDAIGVIGVTAYPPQSFMPAIVDAGAQALVAKEEIVSPRMLTAIRRAARGLPAQDGGAFMDAATAHRMLLAERPRRLRLTPMERKVLACLSDGMTGDEIAARYFMSRTTVYVHTHNAVRKLGVESRDEALSLCRRWHLLDGVKR